MANFTLQVCEKTSGRLTGSCHGLFKSDKEVKKKLKDMGFKETEMGSDTYAHPFVNYNYYITIIAL